jgi:hypothetical protein
VYAGKFKDGKKHGQGKYTYANGDGWEGEYKNGKPNRQGKYRKEPKKKVGAFTGALDSCYKQIYAKACEYLAPVQAKITAALETLKLWGNKACEYSFNLLQLIYAKACEYLAPALAEMTALKYLFCMIIKLMRKGKK